jgi:hypothetical protein
MKNWTPKVGDLVTPDPSMATGPSLRSVLGQVFMVTEVGNVDLSIDREVGEASAHHWLIDRFMPAKSAIINKILSEI